MERWVNDYKIAERIFMGYRPKLPLEAKPVGNGVFAILMETPNADYKAAQESKMIRNDMFSPSGGKDLKRYVQQEVQQEIGAMSKKKLFKILVKKIFGTRRISP